MVNYTELNAELLLIKCHDNTYFKLLNKFFSQNANSFLRVLPSFSIHFDIFLWISYIFSTNVLRICYRYLADISWISIGCSLISYGLFKIILIMDVGILRIFYGCSFVLRVNWENEVYFLLWVTRLPRKNILNSS